MCGIVGIVSKSQQGISWGQLDMFNEMLISDSIRGDDSTGVFSVFKTFNSSYVKLAAHPFALFKTKEYLTWKQDCWNSGRAIIGHNRKATAGAVTNDNAHPFSFGPIVLVHNGFIENHKSLVNYRERDKHKIEVDSNVVAMLLARNEPEKVIPELRGAFALVWYNAKDKSLSFIRNAERPLALSENTDGLYFASERGMLSWLLKRRNIRSELSDLKIGTLLTLYLDDGSWDTKELKVHDKSPIVIAPVPKKVTTPASNVIALPSKTYSSLQEHERWNIHYGNDQPVDPDKVVYPQIVFTCDDYKRVSEDNVYLPVWKLWGAALDSNAIEVQAQFRGTEEDVDKIAYAQAICAKISRVSTKEVMGKTMHIVYCMEPRPVEYITVGKNMPIITEHLNYITKNEKCACNAVDVDTLDPNQFVLARDGFTTKAACVWCIEGTSGCEKLCKEPGKCEACVKAKEKKDEEAKAAAVQAGK